MDLVSRPEAPGRLALRRGSRTRVWLAAGVTLGMLALFSAPAQGVNIPEGGAVTPGSVFVVHFQVQEGCDGAATDALEVSIPEALVNVIPESVPGWEVETEVTVVGDADAEAEPRVANVRWFGGPLADGEFAQFGLWARFPDEPGAVLEFPVIQRCGEIERAWTGTDPDMPAPTVVLEPRIGPRELQELSASVTALEAAVEELGSRLGDVDPANLRTRVSDIEATLEEIDERLMEFRRRVRELEEQAASS